MRVMVSFAQPLPSGSWDGSQPKMPATSGALASWSSKRTSGRTGSDGDASIGTDRSTITESAPRACPCPDGAGRSRGLDVGEVLGEVLAQHVADPAALVGAREAVAAQQLLLADDRLGVRDLPAHGQPL